ncbi:MAG TPA: M20/M25/M40 family metallo-hydrolase [Trueperaceae bacterium]|nr:M20/M25/M40 family metallo-hydrolase [Trueperaceae bacterium]
MKLSLDKQYLFNTLIELLNIPSPTGFSYQAIDYVEAKLAELGIKASKTKKGALLWQLSSKNNKQKTIASHIDTLGAVVKELKENGRLKLSQLGGYDWATIEGAEAKVHLYNGGIITGTVVNEKQSTHVFGSELHELKRTQKVIELRLDAKTDDEIMTEALGVEVGNIVSFDSKALITESGFVKGRHLDNKAAVAICLAVSKLIVENGLEPKATINFYVSNYEEVGHGAATGIPADTDELLCIDMAAVGEGQTSKEDKVTLCVKDSSGPYDYKFNQELRDLAKANEIDLKNDVYPFYGSDASAAWRAGGDFRAALIGPGVDASHAYERSHQDAIIDTAKLVLAYILA